MTTIEVYNPDGRREQSCGDWLRVKVIAVVDD